MITITGAVFTDAAMSLARTSGLRGTLALETKIRGVTEGRNGAFRQGEGSHRFRGVMQG